MSSWETWLWSAVRATSKGRGTWFRSRRWACAASEEPADPAISDESDWLGTTSIGKPGIFLVKVADGDLNGRETDTVIVAAAREGLKTVDATHGGPCGWLVLYNEQAFLIVDVEMLGVAEFGAGTAHRLREEAVPWAAVLRSIRTLRKYRVAKLRYREITAYRGKKKNSQRKPKTRRMRQEMKTRLGEKTLTDVNLVPPEILSLDLTVSIGIN